MFQKYTLLLCFSELQTCKDDTLMTKKNCPSNLHIYTFVLSRVFKAGGASKAGYADSSRAPGLTSGLQGPVNVQRGALLLVPQWQCVSSFVLNIKSTRKVLTPFLYFLKNPVTV